MELYLWFVILLGGLVDLLLLTGAGILAGYPPDGRRLIPGGALGGLYAGAAASAPLYFLGNWYWRIIFMCLICTLGVRGGVGKQYVPVELYHRGKHLHITALRDTGNTLRDPITGRSVVVVGPEVAAQLTGLSHEQLRTPVKSILSLPGGRLIPYKTIADPSGLLLALPIKEAKIGTWKGSCLVAFAPEKLGNGEFEALTGG